MTISVKSIPSLNNRKQKWTGISWRGGKKINGPKVRVLNKQRSVRKGVKEMGRGLHVGA